MMYSNKYINYNDNKNTNISTRNKQKIWTDNKILYTKWHVVKLKDRLHQILMRIWDN